jgi:hypothetical protein
MAETLYACKGVKGAPECEGCKQKEPHDHSLVSYGGCPVGGKCVPQTG